MRHYRNDTLIYLNKNKNREANRIIQRFNLVDDFFNPRGNFINFSSVKKIRAIIITSIISLLIALIIILFLVFYKGEKKKRFILIKIIFLKIDFQEKFTIIAQLVIVENVLVIQLKIFVFHVLNLINIY